MSEKKIWTKVPIKRTLLKILIIIGLLPPFIRTILYGKPPSMSEILATFMVLLLFTWIMNQWKLTVSTDEQGVRIGNGIQERLLRWDDIRQFFCTESQIIIDDTPGLAPIAIDLKTVEDKDSLVSLLNRKLERLLQIECLNCGSVIQANETSCPNCKWSWDEKENIRI